MELIIDKTTKIFLGAIALGITFFISGCDGVNPNGKKLPLRLNYIMLLPLYPHMLLMQKMISLLSGMQPSMKKQTYLCHR